MALTKCPECGGDFSSFASACPHCGFNPDKKSKTMALGIAILIVVPLFLWFNLPTHNPVPKPKPPSLSAGVAVSSQSIEISNKDTSDWTDVSINVNSGVFSGGYNKHLNKIRADTFISIPCSDFTTSDGIRLKLSVSTVQDVFIQAMCDGERRFWGGKLD